MRELIYKAGAFAFFASLSAFTQVSWILSHQESGQLAVRLGGACLVGAALAWGFIWSSHKLVAAKNPESARAIPLICLCMWPGVLIGFGAVNQTWLWLGLGGVVVALVAMIARNWRDVNWRRSAKYCAFIGSLLAFSLLASLLVGEMALRAYIVVGPDYDFAPNAARWKPPVWMVINGKETRFNTVETTAMPGARRVLVIGDSITCGAGLNDAHDLFVNKIDAMFKKNHEPYEINVVARGGREIDEHMRQLRTHGPVYKPNVIVYQWYSNDITVDKKTLPWPHETFLASIPGNDWFMRHSYLWFFMYNKLRHLGNRSYIDYLNQDFKPGSMRWTKFTLYFRMFLDDATRLADRVIIFLYPSIPFQGMAAKDYNLAEVERRVIELANSDDVILPAVSFAKAIGADRPDPSAAFGEVRCYDKIDQTEGCLLFGPYLRLHQGDYRATFHLKARGDGGAAAVAMLEVTSEAGRRTLATKKLLAQDFPSSETWRDFVVNFRIDQPEADNVEFRVQKLGPAAIAIDYVDFFWPLTKKVECHQGIDWLQNLKTWVTPYDAHPNRLAHDIIAKKLHAILVGH